MTQGEAGARDAFSAEEIRELYAGAARLLEEQAGLFARLEENPELILTGLFDPSRTQPWAAFGFAPFEHAREMLPACRSGWHALQGYLVRILEPFLRRRDADVGIDLLRPHYFPSPFVLACRRRHCAILEFDVYCRAFSGMWPLCREGSRARAREAAEAAREEEEERLRRLRAWREDPRLMIRGPLDRARLLLHRGKVLAWLERAVAEAEGALELLRRKEAEALEAARRAEEAAAEMDARYERWREFFLGLGYREKEMRGLMYVEGWNGRPAGGGSAA